LPDRIVHTLTTTPTILHFRAYENARYAWLRDKPYGLVGDHQNAIIHRNLRPTTAHRRDQGGDDTRGRTQEHRDLDAAIAALQESPGSDLIQVQRLKKRKLQLRDRITFIEDELTPDIIA
jgi:hypothetical protein